MKFGTELKSKLVSLFLAAFLTGCSLFPQFNESGKESKLKCLYFLTDTPTIVYECRGKQLISAITILDDTEARVTPVYFDKKFDNPVRQFRFPFGKDSIKEKKIENSNHYHRKSL